MAVRANLNSGKSCDSQFNKVQVNDFSCSFLSYLNSIYCSRDFFHLTSLSCSHCWCYSAVSRGWRSSHRLTLERPSRVSMSPSIKPHSEWVWKTRARISRCLTCQWRPRHLTRTMGDQPFLQDAPHVHVLPGLGRVQLHLQRSSYRQWKLWWVAFKAPKTQN